MKSPTFCSLESRALNNGSLYGRFLLGPFPIDLSLTVATTLRRGLLHSQPTFGIASAEIEGAIHEYAALPGIQESVLELLLNLGEVVLTTTHRNLLQPRFRNRSLFLHNNSGIYIASIRNSGPGIIRAKDINWPEGIFCVNPDAHIATLSTNATLAMRIKIMATASSPSFASFISKEIKEADLDDLENVDGLEDIDNLEDINTLENLEEAREKKKTGSFPLSSQEPRRDEKKNDNTIQLSAEPTEPISNAPELESHFNSVLETEQKTIGFEKKPETISAKSESSNLNLPTKRSQLKETLQTKTEKKLGIKTLRSGLYAPDLPAYSKMREQQMQFGKQNNQALSEQRLSVSKKEEQDSKVSELNNLTSRANQPILKKEQNVSITESSYTNKFFVKKVEKQERGVPLSVSPCSYPVQKVNFVIERDDQWEGYRHRIILEVWTNGSISPRQALFDTVDWSIQLIFSFREPTRFGEKSIPSFATRN